MTNIGLGPGSDGRCELVRNAVTLNSVMINIARIFGASLGGIIASVLGLRCAST